MIYDENRCLLGEGPLWHPLRQEFFWFDILSRRLLTRGAVWDFDEYVSAAGWIDRDRLLIASQSALLLFDLETGTSEKLVGLEADDAVTRSNDGRADPWGGFWIGTMGIEAEAGAGAIYRYYKGELRRLFSPITISNAICFSPDRIFAYFADTPTQKIMRVRLGEKDGWPQGDPDQFIDMQSDGLFPDGCVVDADGNLWNAQWGAGRVACYDKDGRFVKAISVSATQTTCPAFGGDRLGQMLITSAKGGLSDRDLETKPDSGRTFLMDTDATGQLEHQVIL